MPTLPGNTTGTRDEAADLEKLANQLGPLGGKTILVTRDGRLPALDVLNVHHPGLSARIYAAADHYWWAHGQPIAPRDQASAAAYAIARALALPAHE